MDDVIGLFRSFISQKGLRNTPEREDIIKVIFGDHNHFDVDDLYLRLRHKNSKVSKASIYRNIPLIMECGLIKEVWHEDGHMHYEHTYGHRHHCHLRCITCGKVVEFVERDLERISERLGSSNDFEIINHRLDITGYCSKCRNEKEKGQ